MTLCEILRMRGVSLDPKRTKLVRHKDKNHDVQVLKRRGWLEFYQGMQVKGLFDNCDHVVAFVGEEWPRSRFLGLYRVTGKPRFRGIVLPDGCPYTEWIRPKSRFYPLERDPRMAEFEDRLVIEWSGSPLAWHRWFGDREVVEIGPPGNMRPPFTDYLQFTLTFEELQELHAHADANRAWRSRLEAVGGVYLILATTTGQQYVGSATGTGGVWARWMTYAQTRHGGNLGLRSLLEKDPNYPGGFQYSLLHVFPKTTTRAEALALERMCKEKLGSRAVRLNEDRLQLN